MEFELQKWNLPARRNKYAWQSGADAKLNTEIIAFIQTLNTMRKTNNIPSIWSSGHSSEASEGIDLTDNFIEYQIQSVKSDVSSFRILWLGF